MRPVPSPILQNTRELDALRGLAILLVYSYHADFMVRHGTGTLIDWSGTPVSLVTAFVRAGNTGVSLFFVLSGFLLSRPFLVELAGGVRVDRGRYLVRRARRILPLYTVAVLAGAALYAERPADLLRALPYLLFLQSFGWTTDFPAVSGVWWTLATEVQFYLLLPLLPTLARGWIAIGSLAIVGSAYAAFASGLLTPWIGLGRVAMLSHAVLGRGPLLLCGIGAAGLHVRWGEALRRRWGELGRPGCIVADALLVLTLLALGILLRWAVASGLIAVELPPLVAWHIPEGILWASVLLLLLLTRGPLGQGLASEPLVRLGIISYSVYLLHFPLLHVSLGWLQQSKAGVGWSPRVAAAVIGITILCLALSTVTYAAIERPARSWRPRRP